MPATNYPGNPLATQSPSAAPDRRATLTASIPAGSDVRTIESIKQQIQASADFATFLSMSRASFHDDFVDATSVLANRYTITDTNSGVHSVVDDSAQGGYGALKADATAGSTATSETKGTIASGLGTGGDFMWRASIRVPTQTVNTIVQIGFYSGVASNRLFFQLNAATTSWTLKVDTLTPVPLQTVNVTTTTYQTLVILRQAGVLTMAAGGSILYQAADVVNRTGAVPYLLSSGGTMLFMDHWSL